MAGESSGKRNSNTQLLEELEALSNSLYQSHTAAAAAATRRTASLALPRTSQLVPSLSSSNDPATAARSNSRPRRRLSLSPWRSRPKMDNDGGNDEHDAGSRRRAPEERQPKERPKGTSSTASEEKKGGIWNWKPIRALSHIGMQKLSCLLSVEVVSIQNLPSSMNGLRLSVCVRKKETRDGAVQTMPSRVSQGAADFEETLFVRCHVYCTQVNNSNHRNNNQKLKFEARPFWIYAFAVDAEELDFGRSSVDLSQLIQESIEKSHQGARVRSWDTSFGLSGKAKGGELQLKLGFQIMEKDGGIGIYNTQTSKSSPSKNLASSLSPSFARKQSKSSFSVPSPKLSSRKEQDWTPLQTGIGSADDIDDLNLDEPDQKKPIKEEDATAVVPPEPKSTIDNIDQDLDLPDFEVVDKGVEFQDKEREEEEEEESVKSAGEKSAGSEVVVKEIDHVHVARLSELDSIAQQIKALESMMSDDRKIGIKTGESQRLDADEETVTREFLQMLEDEEIDQCKLELGKDDYGGGENVRAYIPALHLEGTELKNDDDNDQSKTYLPDLGKNLGCVVQTRDGGYLAAMNPLGTEIVRKETPKLVMQISTPFVLPESCQSTSGLELFQTMASLGLEKLSSAIDQTLVKSMDDLMGKTAEQVAFEGIASAIIHGRNRSEVASSSAARAIAATKAVAVAMSSGRKERVSTGIWNVSEGAVSADEILAFSMQKIEAMAVEALKVQADMAEEEAPFDVSPLVLDLNTPNANPLSASLPLEDWIAKNNSSDNNANTRTIILVVAIQLRDPIRRYEAVGGPMVALIYAEKEEEERFKVASLHVGGMKVRKSRESERQRLTAMQWLVAYGLGEKAKSKRGAPKHKGQDHLWSVSSRVMADMWLKSMRNPDVKFTL